MNSETPHKAIVDLNEPKGSVKEVKETEAKK